MAWLEPLYSPPPRLRALAKRRPEIDWLCWLPPAEREWYVRDKQRLAWLMSRYPDVEEAEWSLLVM